MAVLIIAEHHAGQINAATLATISAGLRLTDEVDVLLAGSDCQNCIDQLKSLRGLKNILVSENPQFAHPMAEDIAALIQFVANAYSHILAAANTFGKNILPRVAAQMDMAMVADVVEIIDANTFVRPIYAGNAFATVRSNEPIQFITVRTTAFPLVGQNQNDPTITPIEFNVNNTQSQFVELSVSSSDGPELSSAKIIISGGRGLQSAEKFKLIEQLAARLHAAVGASRAAVDAGFVPNDYQVGQTGKVVAPELYIAIGISGAIQHIAGIKDSKIIVAINKDANAPIFEIADYGLVADFFEILPELEAELSKLGY